MKKHAHIASGLWRTTLVVCGLVLAVLLLSATRTTKPELGITWSSRAARDIGLDPAAAFDRVLAELDPAHIRLPVYWDDVEPREGEFDFSAYDEMLEKAGAAGVEVTLAVGVKVPRWPECYIPEWMDADDAERLKTRVRMLLTTTIERYRTHPAVTRFQIENEPFLFFGKCPKPDAAFLKEEFAIARSLTSKPLVMTTSGELEPWLHTIPYADEVGFSLYRLVWSPIIGFWVYPTQSSFYYARVKTLAPFVDEVFVSELQGEPWFFKPPEELSVEDQHQMFSPRMLRNNVAFAKRIGVSRVDVWGAEWWLWMKEHGDASLWEEARRLFQ
ncbi:beta-galactosidase [Candidatus Uhrbacteria bacterium]|nr:beta-galactosidase [Candidatus Uhrbacteria bacterium]